MDDEARRIRLRERERERERRDGMKEDEKGG
jgi:hypothetical protein